MQYKNIEIFLNLVQTSNITKTAEQMFLSQSTISNRLKHLEQELGYQLINRSKGQRMLHLTRQGEGFIPIAERWKNLFEETEHLREKVLLTIRVASSESVYYEMLSSFMIQLMKKHPAVKLSIKLCDSSYIYDLVEKNLIDYGFASYESSRENTISECIYDQAFCVVQYSDNPVPGKSIHPAELDPKKELVFTGGQFRTIRDWHDTWFGPIRGGQVEINSSRAILPYLKEFGYWALFPIHSAESLFQDMPLQIYQLAAPPVSRKIYFLRQSDNALNKVEAGHLFEKELKAYIRQWF